MGSDAYGSNVGHGWWRWWLRRPLGWLWWLREKVRGRNCNNRQYLRGQACTAWYLVANHLRGRVNHFRHTWLHKGWWDDDSRPLPCHMARVLTSGKLVSALIFVEFWKLKTHISLGTTDLARLAQGSPLQLQFTDYSIKNVQVAIVAFGLFSGGATGRSSIGSLTEGADMSLSQVNDF